MGKGFNNYMTKKFFHPGSKENIKRVWMAEQKSVFDKKKQEEMLAQYQREQEMYGNRALLGDEKAKLGLSFMYDPPPGAKKEHVKEDDEPEYKFEWQRKFNAPREKYAKDDDTIRDQPFGIEVRNVRCIKCHKWGHVNTDKICPLFGKNITAEPPQPGMAPKSLMDGMKEDGLAIRSSLLGKRLNPDNPNEQILAEADEDDPEVQFLKSLTSKQKKKLLKKLDKLAKQQAGENDKKKKKKKKHRKESDSDDDGHRKSKKNKKKKKREEASSDSGDSSSDSDSEPASKKYKREISKSEYRKGEKESKDQKRPYESHREWSPYEDKLRHEHTRQKKVSPVNEPHEDRSRKGERSRENSQQDYRRSKSPYIDSRRDWEQRPRHPSHHNQRRSEWDDHRDSGNRGREKRSGLRDSPERLKEDNLRQKYSDRPGYSGDSTKSRTGGRSGGKTGKPRSRHDSSSSSGSDSSGSESSPERPSRRRPRHDSSDSDDSPVRHKKGIGAKSSGAASHRSRNRDRSRSRSRSTEKYRKHSRSPSRTDKHKRHGREKNIHRGRSSSRE